MIHVKLENLKTALAATLSILAFVGTASAQPQPIVVWAVGASGVAPGNPGDTQSILVSTDGVNFSTSSFVNTHSLTDVSFGPSSVWVAAALPNNQPFADDGVWCSDDGGTSWTLKDSGPRRFVHVAGDGSIVAVTEQSEVYRSTDGGENWSLVHQHSIAASTTDLKFNGDIGAFVHQKNYPNRNTGSITLDGGATWSEMAETPDDPSSSVDEHSDPRSVFFLNASTGYLGAQGAQGPQTHIWKTTDGANSWEEQTNWPWPPGGDPLSLHFFDDLIGIGAAGVPGGMWKTTDGATTWTEKLDVSVAGGNVTVEYAVRDVKFANANDGWAIAGSGSSGSRIYGTTDGGETWTVLHDTSPNPTVLIELELAPSVPTGSCAVAPPVVPAISLPSLLLLMALFVTVLTFLACRRSQANGQGVC